MKKTELAKKIERKPWSLFIRNIPPFLHATNQPLVIIHHHLFLKKLYVVLGAYYRLTQVVRSERPRKALLMTYKNPGTKINKKRYDSELPYQRPDLIEVMEIEIDWTTSTNVHTSFYISVRECLD